jgi:hypothetical protein
MTELRTLPVPIPPLHLQQRFADEYRHMTVCLTRHSGAQDHADALFHSLVQRAFAGEL